MVSFDVTAEEARLISKITHRAMKVVEENDLKGYEFQDLEMDITAAHVNDSPIDLNALLHADDATFGHDVFGINRYIDRTTGKLTEFFVPRTARGNYAMPQG